MANFESRNLQNVDESMKRAFIESLAPAIHAGERWAIAKGLTLAESTNHDKQKDFRSLMKLLKINFEYSNSTRTKDYRVAISGPPGAGKSSLIEKLGNEMIDDGHKVAVLAVDPSSVHSGGAILGDKTRMPSLSRRAEAFVRASPSGKCFGGVNRAMLNSVLFVSAAGYDRILIETVGVGQNETSVSNLVDCMVLVLPPVGGDELQMIKRGITEYADIVAVNKADGSTKSAAMKTAASVSGTLHLCRPRRSVWKPPVLLTSAHSGLGVHQLSHKIDEFYHAMDVGGDLQKERRSQLVNLLWEATENELVDVLHRNQEVHKALKSVYIPRVLRGELSVSEAARDILGTYLLRAYVQ